ncbi:MAG TPA: TIGR02996 domain-containing protein, partial [Pirellulales bacterium]
MTWELLDGEAPFLAAATADLADDAPKLIYADWLDERKDKRAAYLRKLVAAGAGGKHADVPAPSNEWHDLLGGHLTRYALGAKKLSAAERASLRVWMLRNARPSLSVKTKNVARTRQTIPLLASQAGGAPALPPDFIWPTRAACEIHDRPGIDFLSPDDPAEFL